MPGEHSSGSGAGSAPGGRLLGYDMARGLAYCGMVAVNFKIAMGAKGGPGWLSGFAGALEGRAAATFVVLAGAGLSLMSRRARGSGDPALLRSQRNTLLRRALFLFAAGLLYCPVWPADILHYYGVYIALGALMLGAPGWALWGASAGAAALAFAMLLGLDYEAGWKSWESLVYLDFWTPEGFVRNLLYNGFHPVFPWVGFLFAGMWLGRLDMGRAKVRLGVFAVAATVAVLAEDASAGLIGWAATNPSEGLPLEEAKAVFGTAPMPPTPFYMLAAGAEAFAAICLCLEAAARFPKAFWLRPLAATGQLALTLYVAHVLVGMGGLEAFGALENRSMEFAMAWAAAFCAASILFARLWRRRFERGPLEALMRKVAG